MWTWSILTFRRWMFISAWEETFMIISFISPFVSFKTCVQGFVFNLFSVISSKSFIFFLKYSLLLVTNIYYLLCSALPNTSISFWEKNYLRKNCLPALLCTRSSSTCTSAQESRSKDMRNTSFWMIRMSPIWRSIWTRKTFLSRLYWVPLNWTWTWAIASF